MSEIYLSSRFVYVRAASVFISEINETNFNNWFTLEAGLLIDSTGTVDGLGASLAGASEERRYIEVLRPLQFGERPFLVLISTVDTWRRIGFLSKASY